MKKLFTMALVTLAFTQFDASADVTIKLPADSGIDSVMYYYASIEKLATAKSRAERGVVQATVPVVDNKVTVTIDPSIGSYQFGSRINDNAGVSLYGAPGEEAIVTITSIAPFEYNVSGNKFHEDSQEVENELEPIRAKIKALRESGQANREALEPLYKEMETTLEDYIEENLTSPNAAYAVMMLSGENQIKAYDRLSERAKTSIIYPLLTAQVARTKESLENERKQQEMANGSTPAPNFTLKDLAGKDVLLSEFKGKWVILDFWGSWCIWCIKGFPELKEAYAKYKDRLEVIGIDCNETEEAWKAGVAKYELPWVNVYCPKGNPLFKEYGIQAFPTKAIIDPEGKIRNITMGHDPEFFVALDKLLAE